MIRRILALVAAALVALTAHIPASIASHAVGAPAPLRYYLALGDSLSQGVQPNPAGVYVDTSEGYPDQLLAILRRRTPGLHLVKLGCPGETTTSMLTGQGDQPTATILHCDRAGGSQLTAAVAFLAHHRQVSLITIDIGANDFYRCFHQPDLAGCVAAAEATIDHNLPLILGALRRAAPSGVKLAGTTLYDPALAGYFSADAAARVLAARSVSIVRHVNGLIAQADRAAGFLTADVAGAFGTYDTADTVPFDGRMIPFDVARVCSWTWACNTPPSGPNIHPNKDGYAVFALAFSALLGGPV